MLFIGLSLFIGGIVGLILVYIYESIYTIPKKQYKRMREHEKAYHEAPLDVHENAFICEYLRLNEHQIRYYKKQKFKELQEEQKIRLKKQAALKYLNES
nr:MAG TPA: protein of unknown function (DUF4538) [Bacteriophage sp.]